MTLARARTRAVAAGLLAALVALVAPRGARAAGARVVLLGRSGATPVTIEALARARAELTAAGFVVEPRVLASDEPPRESVERALDAADVLAALALVDVREPPRAAPALVDVWSAERLTGKTSVQRIAAQPRPGEESAAAVVAVRAVEALRASLLELAPTTAQVAPAAPAAPPARADVAAFVAPPSRARASLSEGLAVSAACAALAGSASAGDLAVAPRFTLGGGGRWLGGRAVVVGPSSATRYAAAAGRASVHQLVAGGELVLARPSRGRWLPGATVGAGVASVSVAGTGNAPWVGESPSLVTAYGSVGLELAVRLGGPVLLDAAVTGLAFTRAATVRIGDAAVASLGRPALVASLGVAAGF